MNQFFKQIAKIINSDQSNALFLTGNVYDLFFDGKDYVPLINYLIPKCQMPPDKDHKGKTVLVYEINRSLKVYGDQEGLAAIWNKINKDQKYEFNSLLNMTSENTTLCIEFLRQLTECVNQNPQMKNDLIIIIEGMHLLVPLGTYQNLNSSDRRRVGVFYDWLSDHNFVNGKNSVILIAESRSLVNPMISNLPTLATVDIPAPDLEDRIEYAKYLVGKKLIKEVKYATITAGLTLYAYRQILLADDDDKVVEKIQEYISGQLGDDVVEFKNPKRKIKDLIGFTKLKKFLVDELIPRFKATDSSALTGACVGGSIGGGKTFVFEAVASELGMIVLVLKNLRSQWFGQTDVIFERLRRLLMALDKVCIFIDEADTQFGGVGADTHETERRLTGKIQAMMSDPLFKGKVVWLLMTARINLLSPDIRRPGRVGDLIIPVLDPEGEDREHFIKWACEGIEIGEFMPIIDSATAKYSVAAFASLKSNIQAKKCKTVGDVKALLDDLIQPDMADVRRYQSLQAMLNCTRRSLLPVFTGSVEDQRYKWQEESDKLEIKLRY